MDFNDFLKISDKGFPNLLTNLIKARLLSELGFNDFSIRE
jgi:hypothetical protein